MLLTRVQILSMFINLGVILLGVGLTFLTIHLTKLKDAQTRLIFILYMIFWIPTLMCRDYTGLMAEHTVTKTRMSIIFIPLLMYGLIGLFARPGIDILSFKLKSRRSIIFIALGIQFATFMPFIFVPCVATNIIQSMGCGIGASCIGLFNLLFDDRESKRTVFATVSILSIPPILAQFFASAIETLVAVQVPAIYSHADYLNVMLGLWTVSIILIVACVVITFFIKPRPKLFYIAKKQKYEIKNKHHTASFIMLCLAAMFLVFVRWTTAGPTTGIQLTYISTHYGVDMRYYEGWSGFIYTAGQLIGTIITGYATTKLIKYEDKVRVLLVLASCVCGWAYCITSGFCLGVWEFVGLLAISGLSYGLLYPIIIGLAVKKIFVRRKHLTPVGVLNTFLALGIVFGTFVVSYFKAPMFDQIHGFSTYSWNDFRLENWHIMLIDIVFIFLIMVCYGASYFIYKKHPQKKVTAKQMANLMGDTEM